MTEGLRNPSSFCYGPGMISGRTKIISIILYCSYLTKSVWLDFYVEVSSPFLPSFSGWWLPLQYHFHPHDHEVLRPINDHKFGSAETSTSGVSKKWTKTLISYWEIEVKCYKFLLNVPHVPAKCAMSNSPFVLELGLLQCHVGKVLEKVRYFCIID